MAGGANQHSEQMSAQKCDARSYFAEIKYTVYHGHFILEIQCPGAYLQIKLNKLSSWSSMSLALGLGLDFMLKLRIRFRIRVGFN